MVSSKSVFLEMAHSGGSGKSGVKYTQDYADAATLAGMDDPAWLAEAMESINSYRTKDTGFSVQRVSPLVFLLTGGCSLNDERTYEMVQRHASRGTAKTHPLSLISYALLSDADEANRLLRQYIHMRSHFGLRFDADFGGQGRGPQIPALPYPARQLGLDMELSQTLIPASRETLTNLLPLRDVPLITANLCDATYPGFKSLYDIQQRCDLELGPKIEKTARRLLPNYDKIRDTKSDAVAALLSCVPDGVRPLLKLPVYNLLWDHASAEHRIEGLQALCQSKNGDVHAGILSNAAALDVNTICAVRATQLPELLHIAPWRVIESALKEDSNAILAHLTRFIGKTPPSILQACVTQHEKRRKDKRGSWFLVNEIDDVRDVNDRRKVDTEHIRTAAAEVLELCDGDRYLAAVAWAASLSQTEYHSTMLEELGDICSAASEGVTYLRNALDFYKD